jgi:hypothetical protein
MFHSRKVVKVDKNWSGIRACRLSEHHGEFCKLFCSQTSREVDFFDETGMHSGEQLFNMIDFCTVFSSGKAKDCSEFRSLFSVNDDRKVVHTLQVRLDSVKSAAARIRDARNTLAHNILALKEDYLQHIFDKARQLFSDISGISSFISGENLSVYAEQALIEIEAIEKRSVCLATLTDVEYQNLIQEHERLREDYDQIIEERDRLQGQRSVLKSKLARKFDSFLAYLKRDIEDQFTESTYTHSHPNMMY